MDPKSDDSGAYDLAEAAPQASPPNLPQPLSYQSVKPPTPVSSRNSGAKTSDETDPEQLRTLYIPLWILCGGALIECISAAIRLGYRAAGTYVLIDIVLSTLLVFPAIAIAAKARGFELGSFGSALLRVAALGVGPSAVMTLGTPFFNAIPILGGIVGLICEFVLYFALLGVLFDLDESDTWYCLCIIFIIRVAIFLLITHLLTK
jgi:hypothetical protein